MQGVEGMPRAKQLTVSAPDRPGLLGALASALGACSNINPPAWVLFGVTAVVAAVDWTAVARSIRRLEYVAKPAVMVGLIAVALAMHPVSAIERTFFVVALVLGLASDVFLML